MKKYFLFDLDGTLNDTGPGIMDCVQYALGRLGWHEQPESFLRQFVGPPLTDSFMNFCHMDASAAENAIRLYRERYWEWGVYQSPLYPGIKELLERLSERAALCVATSKNEKGARQVLRMREIEPYFSVVVGDDGTRPTKAHVIAEALRELEEPDRSEVLMIGDRSYDIAGAKDCGVEAAGVLYGYGSREELETAGADYLAGTVRELEALCMELAGLRE